MVLGIGVQKMFRSSEDLRTNESNLSNTSSNSNDGKKQAETEKKGRRKSLIFEHRSSPSRESAGLSTQLCALNLAEASSPTKSASFPDLGGDSGNLSASGTFFRRKCLEESVVEEEKENVLTYLEQQQATPSNSTDELERHNRQPKMGIQAKQMSRGISRLTPLPIQQSQDFAEELKRLRLKQSRSFPYMKNVDEEKYKQPNHNHELDGASDFERSESKAPFPPVPKPRLSLLQKLNAADAVDKKPPTITPRPRYSKSAVSLNLPTIQLNGIVQEMNLSKHPDESVPIPQMAPLSTTFENRDGSKQEPISQQIQQQQIMYCLPYQS